MTEAEAENVIIEKFPELRKLKQKNNYSVGMYYFAEGVTVKVLNSYTENIESSGWFGRFMKMPGCVVQKRWPGI